MIVIIANSQAGSADQMPALHRAIASQADVVLHETHSAEEATTRAEEALREGVETIVAAGGDGTINAVVNGLSADFSKATLGVIPLGTGNDLARTLALPMKPLAALELLTSGVARHLAIDLGCRATSGCHSV